VGQRVDTVVTAIRPEVDQKDLAAQFRNIQRSGIEPGFDADKVRCRNAGVRQCHRRGDLAFIGTWPRNGAPNKQTAVNTVAVTID
jgi:hypothetical protein